MTRFWKKPGASAAFVNEKIALENMPHEVSAISSSVNSAIGETKSNLDSVIKKALSTVREKKISASGIAEASFKKLENAIDRLKVDIAGYKAEIKKLPLGDREISIVEGKLARAEKKLDMWEDIRVSRFEAKERLSDEIRTINKYITLPEKDPAQVAKLLEADPNFKQLLGDDLNDYMKLTSEYAGLRNSVYRSKSPNMADDRKFFEEYLHMKDLKKQGNETAGFWFANVDNKKKLDQLIFDKDKYRKLGLIEDPEKIRETLSKMQRTDAAVALGLPAAALTGIAYAYFTWADDNVKEIQYKSETLVDKLNNLEVSGAGENVLLDAKNAVAAINGSSERIDTLLHDPKNSAGEIGKSTEILRLGKEKLDVNLQKWGNVVNNSTDPDTAKAVGSALKSFSNDVGDRLNKLADKVGMPRSKQAPDVAGPSTPSMAGQRKTTREDIIALQEYLSDTDPRIGPTGVLDSATIGMLKQLESKYNRLGNTNDFTGLLVNPEEGMAISLEDLKGLLKYK